MYDRHGGSAGWFLRLVRCTSQRLQKSLYVTGSSVVSSQHIVVLSCTFIESSIFIIETKSCKMEVKFKCISKLSHIEIAPKHTQR